MGGGKQKSSSKSTTETKTPEQKATLKTALELYEPQLGQGEPLYGGQTVAGLDPLQQRAQEIAGGFLDAFEPGAGNIPLYGETGAALSGVLSGQTGAEQLSEQDIADFYQRTVADPARRQFSEEIRPLIREEYAGPGFYSSARSGAVTKGAQDLGYRLSEGLAQAQFENLRRGQDLDEARAGRSLSAVPAAMQFGQMPSQIEQQKLAGLSAVSEFGRERQAQEQAEIAASIQRFADENRLTSQEDMAIIMGLLGLDFTTQTQKSSSSGFSFSL
jgi:hypothetical protein